MLNLIEKLMTQTGTNINHIIMMYLIYILIVSLNKEEMSLMVETQIIATQSLRDISVSDPSEA